MDEDYLDTVLEAGLRKVSFKKQTLMLSPWLYKKYFAWYFIPLQISINEKGVYNYINLLSELFYGNNNRECFCFIPLELSLLSKQ